VCPSVAPGRWSRVNRQLALRQSQWPVVVVRVAKPSRQFPQVLPGAGSMVRGGAEAHLVRFAEICPAGWADGRLALAHQSRVRRQEQVWPCPPALRSTLLEPMSMWTLIQIPFPQSCPVCLPILWQPRAVAWTDRPMLRGAAPV
jgi:hypothetical protein